MPACDTLLCRAVACRARHVPDVRDVLLLLMYCLPCTSMVLPSTAHKLIIPRRPPWDGTTTPDQLDAQEKASFLNWRRCVWLRWDEAGAAHRSQATCSRLVGASPKGTPVGAVCFQHTNALACAALVACSLAACCFYPTCLAVLPMYSLCAHSGQQVQPVVSAASILQQCACTTFPSTGFVLTFFVSCTFVSPLQAAG